MAFSDARNESDRAAGDTSGRSSGGGGDRARQAEARNREAMGRALRGDRPASRGTISSTAAQHQIAIGKTAAPLIPSGGIAQGNYPSQDDAMSDYAGAVGKHATRGFFDKALDFLGGGLYDPKEPMAGNPRSFAGGDYHSTTNPGSVIGAAAGMVGGPVGSIVGKLAGPAYTAAGLPEIWHGGYDQPDLRGGPLGNTSAPMGASMADIGRGHTTPSGAQPGVASAASLGAPSGPRGTGATSGLWGRNALARALRAA